MQRPGIQGLHWDSGIADPPPRRPWGQSVNLSRPEACLQVEGRGHLASSPHQAVERVPQDKGCEGLVSRALLADIRELSYGEEGRAVARRGPWLGDTPCPGQISSANLCGAEAQVDGVCSLRPRPGCPSGGGRVRPMGPPPLLRASCPLALGPFPPQPGLQSPLQSSFHSSRRPSSRPAVFPGPGPARPCFICTHTTPPTPPPAPPAHTFTVQPQAQIILSPWQDEGQSAPQGGWRRTAPNGQPREGARAKYGKGGVCGGPLGLLPICLGWGPESVLGRGTGGQVVQRMGLEWLWAPPGPTAGRGVTGVTSCTAVRPFLAHTLRPH